MPEPMDLSKLLRDKELHAEWNEERRHLDLSGKPKPEDVRVQLNSGIIVNCDVRYDGLDPDKTRRFLIICEFDWENYFPKTLIVGVHPTDTTLSFRVPGVPDDVCNKFAAGLHVVSEKVVYV